MHYVIIKMSKKIQIYEEIYKVFEKIFKRKQLPFSCFRSERSVLSGSL